MVIIGCWKHKLNCTNGYHIVIVLLQTIFATLAVLATAVAKPTPSPDEDFHDDDSGEYHDHQDFPDHEFDAPQYIPALPIIVPEHPHSFGSYEHAAPLYTGKSVPVYSPVDSGKSVPVYSGKSVPVYSPVHSGKSIAPVYPGKSSDFDFHHSGKSVDYDYPTKSAGVPVIVPELYDAPYHGAEYANYAPQHDHEHYVSLLCSPCNNYNSNSF